MSKKVVKLNQTATDSAMRTRKEDLGIWSVYAMSGGAPENVTYDELKHIETSPTTVDDVSAIVSALTYKNTQLIDLLVAENSILKNILTDKLNITEKDYQDAKAKYVADNKAFQESLSANIAENKIKEDKKAY